MYHTLPGLLLLLVLTLFFPSSLSSSPPQPGFPSKDAYDAKPVPPHPTSTRTSSSENSTNNNSVNIDQRLLRRFLSPRQATPSGRCGAAYANQVCSNNQCCSSFGYCGTEFEYCGDIVGCQPLFGRCGDGPVSTTVAPRPTFTFTSSSSMSTLSSSSSSSSFSSTLVSVSLSSSSLTTPSASSPLPSATLIPSTNGQCGNVTTCAGSVFGNCCSEYYFCGQGLAFCGEGCRVGFGVCGGGGPGLSSSSMFSSSTFTPSSTSTSASTSTSTTPTPTNVSTAGRCGADGNGQTCTGSRFGRCCSSYGWCGDDANDYCKVLWGCQVEFGVCTS